MYQSQYRNLVFTISLLVSYRFGAATKHSKPCLKIRENLAYYQACKNKKAKTFRFSLFSTPSGRGIKPAQRRTQQGFCHNGLK